MLALIVLSRLSQISVQELASDINDRLDGSTNRVAIDVNVEHTHKNRNARHLFVAQPFWTKQFPWRRDVLDERDEPSAGAMIRFSSRGVTRTGSRKNASTQTVNMIKGHVSQGTKSHASTAIAAAIAANLRPSG